MLEKYSQAYQCWFSICLSAWNSFQLGPRLQRAVCHRPGAMSTCEVIPTLEMLTFTGKKPVNPDHDSVTNTMRLGEGSQKAMMEAGSRQASHRVNTGAGPGSVGLTHGPLITKVWCSNASRREKHFRPGDWHAQSPQQQEEAVDSLQVTWWDEVGVGFQPNVYSFL